MNDLNLLWNDPVDLEKEDLLLLKRKAKNIKNFLTNQTDKISRSIIISLNGEWGSGKTTILNYLGNSINKNEYIVLQFNAWEYEKDGNLILSIIDGLNSKNVSKSKKINKIIKESINFLITFSSSVSLNIGFINFKISRIFESFRKNRKLSNFEEIRRFKENYIKIENLLLENKQKIIILIDEIDRCDPENVINMINFIKLFFTYGKKTIFLIALDEEAIIQAINIKYHNIIKGKEYMEKIFDFTFRMSSFNPMMNLTEYYFKNKFEDFEHQILRYINQFFYTIKFTNPRKVKKVLSKFLYLKIISENEENKELFDMKSIFSLKENKILYILIQLFLIILYEFYNEKFYEIEKSEQKIENFINSINNFRIDEGANLLKREGNNFIKTIFVNTNNYSIQSTKNDKNTENKNNKYTNTFLFKLITIFLPNPPIKLDFSNKNSINNLIEQFNNNDNDNEISINFCKFIVNNVDLIDKTICPIPIKRCFDIVNNYL